MNVVGAGNRYVAQVDQTNRLLTRSVSLDDGVDASFRGDGFFLFACMTISDAAETALFTFRNDEDQDMVVTVVQAAVGDSTGGTTDNARFKIDALSTELTMIGGTGTPIDIGNLIVSNPNELDSISELGQTGATISPAQLPFLGLPVKTGSFTDFNYFWILPKGSHLYVSVVPPVGNTSIDVEIDMTVYLRTPEL